MAMCGHQQAGAAHRMAERGDRAAERGDHRLAHRDRVVAVAVPDDRAVGPWGVAVAAVVERGGVEPIGEFVAHLATSRLDGLYLLTRLQDARALEERMRVARDLHDSLLQSQAGAALQLLAARRVLDGMDFAVYYMAPDGQPAFLLIVLPFCEICTL